MKIGILNLGREDSNVFKGLVAGMVAGLVATYAKDRFQTLMTEVSQAEVKRKRGPNNAPGSQSKEDPSTVKAANAVTKRIAHRELTKEEKGLAGPIVDYGFGALTGTAYGAMAEIAPQVGVAGGTAFGATVWL